MVLLSKAQNFPALANTFGFTIDKYLYGLKQIEKHNLTLMQPLTNAIRTALETRTKCIHHIPHQDIPHHNFSSTATPTTNYSEKKHDMKVYGDHLKQVKTVTFSLKDSVLLWQTKKNKFSTLFDPKTLYSDKCKWQYGHNRTKSITTSSSSQTKD